MVKEAIINIIKEYVNELIRCNVILTKVILYGSHAKNTANENSDIDLMIVSPFFDKNRDKYLGLIWKLTAKSDFKIEPYPVGSERFESDDTSPIIQIAKREGIEIVIN